MTAQRAIKLKEESTLTPGQKLDHAAAMLRYAQQDRLAAQKKVLDLIKAEAQAAIAYRIAVNAVLDGES